MPLANRARRSDGEVYDQRIADAQENDPVRHHALTRLLTGTVHFRALTPSAEYIHDRLYKLWKLFLEKRPLGAEHWPVVIKEGVVIPTHDLLKDFVRFLAIVVQGRIATFAKKKTIQSYLWTFFALWRRRTFDCLPKNLRNKTFDYLNSTNFKQTITLTTASRTKEYADIIDVAILIKEIFKDKTCFRTHHGRIMAIYAILLAALSSERPGAIIESSNYRGSNEALVWGDHQFWVIHNPDDTSRPLIALITTIRLLKGLRTDDSATKQFFILQEPSSHRLVDGLLYALVLAFNDDIFQDVKTIEEIFHPKYPTTGSHMLRIKADKQNLPVIRKETMVNGMWSVANELAMPYSMIANRMRMLSLKAGFRHWITFYCFRRGTANRLAGEIPADERKLLMGHSSNSNQFYTSYMSRRSTIDLGAILAQNTNGPDPEHQTVIKALGGMSHDLDPNAPLTLNAAEVAEMLAEPELVELREKRKEVSERIAMEKAKLEEIPEDDDETHQAQCDVIETLEEEELSYFQSHKAKISTEERFRFEEKRKKYFDEASMRQLTGQQGGPKRTPMANISVNSPRRVAPQQSTSAQKENAPRAHPAVTIDNRSIHFVSCAKALIGLPARPSALCYPGEGPTQEGKCPVCDVELSPQTHTFSANNMATHIHKCVLDDARIKATAELEKEYSPQLCWWKTCKVKGVFETRASFAAHIRHHTETAKNAGWSGSKAVCRWVDEEQQEVCGDIECDEEHMGRAHQINVWPQVRVEYDALSSDTFIDIDGDGDTWRERCNEQYMELYEPFAVRTEDEVEFDTKGVTFSEGCVLFENGEGFGGERPEYHGHIERLVALAAPFAFMKTTLTLWIACANISLTTLSNCISTITKRK
ncbi:hypothetical protein MIND_01259000 [Mycena indigotica]|uniref:Uncharacterized protein n=1 Tax=Mycena indigotica TaxID=2126181 RepID=A0A8H6S2K3_9AGAR|nr:uncharacterized protein MIND_01259000 [Mycena indigotica]KAF7291158.1 hypothetical protein MIND_01259000 [Mycena indigotica]